LFTCLFGLQPWLDKKHYNHQVKIRGAYSNICQKQYTKNT
jgi:hypothetical protein